MEDNRTPLRNVRIASQLWEDAKAAAQANGETISDVIRRALTNYVKRNKR